MVDQQNEKPADLQAASPATSEAGRDAAADEVSTDAVLQRELDTLASILGSPPPPANKQRYADESGCQRVVELVAAIGRDPSVAPGDGAEPAEEVQTPPMETLGQYKLLGKLGEGGMGAVYKALHTRLQKVVALKILPADKLKNEDAVTRFDREMRAVGQLNHPNIIAAHDAGEIDGNHYLVMELVDGVDVSNLVKRFQEAHSQPIGLPIPEACEIIRQAAVGLQHAHEHGMVHRDIKPSNLMVAFSGQHSAVSSQASDSGVERPEADSRELTATVKILDLGLALLDECEQGGATELTGSGQMMGTVDYMAPEQGGDSHKVDIRADIYALGATLYKLLAGQAPFAGEKYGAIINKLMALATETPTPLHEICDDVPRELSDFVARLLSKDPDQRAATPREVAEALAPFAEGARLADLLQFVEQAHDAETNRTSDTFVHLSSSFVDTHPPAADHPAPGARAHAKPTIRRWLPIAAGIAIVFLAATLVGPWLWSVLFTIETLQGTITIEVPEGEENNIEIAVLEDGKRVKILDVANGWTVHLEDGQYRLDLHKGGDRFQLDASNLTVTKADKMRVMVTFKPTQLAKPSRDVGTQPPQPAKAPFDADQAKDHQDAWAHYLGLPVEREFELPGGVKMELVLIPPGEFMMGSPEPERQSAREQARANNDDWAVDTIPTEGPQHGVKISKPFYLGKYEVTQNQWLAMMGNNPSHCKGPSNPVEQVSWDDVQPFLAKLNVVFEKKGMICRLPTEAEWEYACRAGTTMAFGFGENPAMLAQHGWYDGNAGRTSHPVGQAKPNAWGLFDMHANVWEWCADWYAKDYYSRSPQVDPVGPSTGSTRVYRGGGLVSHPEDCRSAFRCSHPPDVRRGTIGFRVALVPARRTDGNATRFTLIVVIQTGSKKYDGTTSPVYILINDDESLKRQIPEHLGSGSAKSFAFDFEYPVSKVESITVQMGGNDAWRVRDFAFQIRQDKRYTEMTSLGGGYFSTERELHKTVTKKTFMFKPEFPVPE